MDIQEFIDHPESLDKNSLYELRGLLARYPYFEPARLLYLKNLYVLHDASFGDELGRSVVYITDRPFMYYYIENEFRSRCVRDIAGDERNTDGEDRTLGLIDAFLASRPEESDYAATGDGIAADYTSYLLEKKDEEDTEMKTPLRGQNIIDRFIEEDGGKNSFVLRSGEERDAGRYQPEDPDGEPDDDSCFTETLARIYIKQQRYSKALEIIKKLSLKYPEKNAYFAERIKFLENRIINDGSKEN